MSYQDDLKWELVETLESLEELALLGTVAVSRGSDGWFVCSLYLPAREVAGHVHKWSGVAETLPMAIDRCLIQARSHAEA